MKNAPLQKKKKKPKSKPAFGSLPGRLRSDAAPGIRNNPFELKINREKFSVLGRSKKHTVGLPGVSRSRAIQKRKETLLKEFRLKDKNNKFVDRRFAEYDSKITPEEKILQRFTLERQRAHDKKSVFNLNEDEELTHFGQTLAELEKLPEAQQSDEEEDERGLLSAELTEAHFGGGGGLLRKKSDGGDENRARSRQQLIEEMILRSKQNKRERQAERSEAQELTEKLDQDWKSIQSLLSHKSPRVESTERPTPETYDVMVRELGFEMKAQPSEKLKSAEETAREERQRLQDLEEDRVRRMMGDGEEPAERQTHVSADDLNDGFLLDADQRKILAYEDGKWNIEEEKQQEEEEEIDAEVAEGKEEDEAADDDEEEEEEEDDDHDLESEAEGSEEEEEEEKEEQPCDEEAQKRRREAQEAARVELPYTFKAPDSLVELQTLLAGRSAEQTQVILERTIKSNHPSQSSRSGALQKLFGFLLEHIGSLCSRSVPDLQTLDALVPAMQSLSQLFPTSAAAALQTLIRDTAHALDETLEVRGRAPMPDLETLVLLKVSVLLFSSSDFRHPVCTPALLLICQTLSKCAVLSLQDVCKGVFLCALALECVSLSQRFIPELTNFLLGILHLAVPDKPRADYTLVSPFRQQGRGCDLLLLTNRDTAHSWRRRSMRVQTLGRVSDRRSKEEEDHCRLSVLDSTLDLLRRTALLYKDLPSFSAIFQPIRVLLLHHLPVDTLPAVIQERHQEALEALPPAPSQNAPLVFRRQKPIALKLLTPKIVEILEHGKKRGNSREERERERLKHKVKREFKGALREIRKDTRFLAHEKLKDTLSRDSERKRKVKELYGSLATQEGEWKALKRGKRK